MPGTTLAVPGFMRKLVLCALGLVMMIGCAANQSSWKVRDADGWPKQTWDAGEVYRAPAPRVAQRCNTPLQRTAVGTWVCCDQPVTSTSWGPRAAPCGGRKARVIEVETATGPVIVDAYRKTTPPAAATPAPTTVRPIRPVTPPRPTVAPRATTNIGYHR